MADSRLESITTILNLFILLLVLSLVASKYNGPNPDGLKVLGWTTVSITVICYLFGFVVKIWYVPCLER